MHRTLHPDVKGYIDENEATKVVGWCFNAKNNSDNKFSVKDNDDKWVLHLELERPDVVDFYKGACPLQCGFQFERSPTKSYTMFLNGDKVFTFEQLFDTTFTPSINIFSGPPTLIVADNFYEDPDSVRQFALNVPMVKHPKYHKGHRSDKCYRFPGLKERFETLIGAEIDDFNRYGTNGCFQFCVKGDEIVYHCDTQQYAGVLFLTPDAPPNSGTRLLRSKHNKKMRPENDADSKLMFADGFLDESHFETVDTVGNVYKRLVLFASENIHAATAYFGDNKDNGRLFQLFFFDLKK
jgi:hypothetical protein